MVHPNGMLRQIQQQAASDYAAEPKGLVYGRLFFQKTEKI